MTVPFEKLGPGQSGRWAYQVLGKNGPIFNPSGIRYLGVDEAPRGNLPVAPNARAMTALSALNLGVATANLVVSAATYRSVQRLHKKTDAALALAAQTSQQLREMHARVERIDIRTSEASLRAAMDHVFRGAVHDDGIDVEKLAPLANDVDRLLDAVGNPVLFRGGVYLSTDVREKLHALFSLLFDLRCMVASEHNRVEGASRNVVVDPHRDYAAVAQIARTVAAFSESMAAMDELEEALRKDLDKRFLRCNDEDLEAVSRYVTGARERSTKALRENDRVAYCLYDASPSELFQGESSEDIVGNLANYARAWLWTSDVGLAYRTKVELRAIEQGYESVFWPQLAGHSSEVSVIDASCVLTLPAG